VVVLFWYTENVNRGRSFDVPEIEKQIPRLILGLPKSNYRVSGQHWKIDLQEVCHGWH
jgi:hypothetical protein